MAIYKVDTTDFHFNLFELLKVQDLTEFGLDVGSIKDILQEYEKFVRTVLFPTREPSDIQGIQLKEGKVIAPACLHEAKAQYYENGWFALGLPEDIGGTPVPEAVSLACLSMGTSANVGFAMYPGLSKAALNVIRLKGSDEIKKRFIPGMMDGRWGGAMGLTEPGAGSDVGALLTTAKPKDDGTWSIKGMKMFISSGEVDFHENTIHLVLARTPNGGPGTKGISLFIVPRNWVNESGVMEGTNHVVCTKIEEKMGIHSSATCELSFGEKGETRGILIGDEFDGMATMFIMMNEARLLCGLQGESQSSLAYEMSKNYASQRVQFGVTLDQHPDVRKMLLKMRCVVRAMRSLQLYTGNLFNLAHNKTDPHAEAFIGILTPICKAHFTDQSFLIGSEAVQVHGGYGFCKEYGVEQFVRDSIIGRIYEGTNGIQSIDLVTRKILKDGGKNFGVFLKIVFETFQKLPSPYASSLGVVKTLMTELEKTTQLFFSWGSQKKMNLILRHATDYTTAVSMLFMSWRLAEGALVAGDLLEKNSSSYTREYLQSKQFDFTFYAQNYLPQSIALLQTAQLGVEDITQVVV
ncbi:MAG: acyl-CoA dehydrogenase [Bacteriovoracaceae bacterium]|nr:acyl-CoA dehydrogenase [Bacteriovoracaceae bacterium]